jgi:hypothetical protein
MSSYVQKYAYKVFLLMVGAVFFVCLTPFTAFADTTNVSNSVSVSSSGSEDSYASVKTVINGETVEDIELHGPGTIESNTGTDGTTVHTVASNTIITSTDNSRRDEQIRELIAKLMELIEHYVSLLNAIS